MINLNSKIGSHVWMGIGSRSHYSIIYSQLKIIEYQWNQRQSRIWTWPRAHVVAL